MKSISEILMILCYAYMGIWASQSTSAFQEGDSERGWYALIYVAVFALFGSLNLGYVKKDCKKEGK